MSARDRTELASFLSLLRHASLILLGLLASFLQNFIGGRGVLREQMLSSEPRYLIEPASWRRLNTKSPEAGLESSGVAGFVIRNVIEEAQRIRGALMEFLYTC